LSDANKKEASLKIMAVNYGGKALNALASSLDARVISYKRRRLASRTIVILEPDGHTRENSKPMVGEANYDSIELGRVRKRYPFSTAETVMVASILSFSPL
jgi:hypothetical protein